MASSSDGPPGDPMVSEPPTSDETSNKSTTTSKATNSKEKHLVTLRFEFKIVNNDAESFAAPSIHRNMLTLLERSFPSTTVIFKGGNEVCPSSSTDETFGSSFEYKIFERSKHRLVCVAHSISTTASFAEIKSTMHVPLRENNCFVRVHKWGSELDIVNIGWLYKSHPTTHNRDQIKSNISKACDGLNIPFVDFELYTKGLSFLDPETKIRTKTYAIQFACPKSTASSVKSLLKACFDDPNTYLPGKFIPSDLAVTTNNDNAFEKYLKLQNKYLSNHRSIRIDGIHPSTLASPIKNARHLNLIEIANSCDWIDWLSFTSQTETNGKIVLSTTEAHYSGALQWVDKTFLDFHKKIPNKTFPPQFEGTEAVRITRGPTRRDKYDSYTQSLLSDLSDLSDGSYSAPPQNAWLKPLSIVATSMTKSNTTNISEQESSITNTNNVSTSDISELTEMVSQLRNDVKEQLRIQQESIEAIVEQTITKKIADLDKRYEAIVDKINERWEEALNKQLAKAEKDMDETVDKIIAKRDQIHKQQRSDPGSGSSRMRKQARSIPTGHLDSVKTGLITKYMTVDVTMENKNKNE